MRNSYTKYCSILSNVLGGDVILDRRTEGRTDGGDYNIQEQLEHKIHIYNESKTRTMKTTTTLLPPLGECGGGIS